MSEEKLYVRNGAETATEPKEALEWSRRTQAKLVDLKFTDLLGSWQHMTLPLSAFDEASFEEGLGFDGSSIRGWQGISESDMLLMPQADTAILDPFTETPTLSILCEIIDPITREPYSRDPRRIARRAEAYLVETGHQHGGKREVRVRGRIRAAELDPLRLRRARVHRDADARRAVALRVDEVDGSLESRNEPPV